jgi:predicted TIM-barrel fold metal-dependent hydrolase
MEQLLKRTMKERALSTLPETLDQYVAKVVTATLEQHRRDGAVAVKFEAAYLRPLAFADASADEARRVYAQHVKRRVAPPAEYKTLQDYLFRCIARESGRLGMAVHIHVGVGAGSYFDLAGSNPTLLDPTLNDPSLRETRFVLIHGGWPFHGETAFLLAKPNVYADFSAMTFLLSARSLAEVLRTWIEWYPEKILFGTDGFTFSPEVGWEEMSWLSNRTGRDALALALTGLTNDGEITRDRALELARMVMRESALRLYKLDGSAGHAVPPPRSEGGGK